MLMPAIFALIKVMAIIQLVVVIGLLLIAYSIRIYKYYNNIHLKHITESIEHIFIRAIQNPDRFDPTLLKRYIRHPFIIIDHIIRYDSLLHDEKWDEIRNKIIDFILLPNARILARSNYWYLRYIASGSFQPSLKLGDKSLIKALIHDPVPLVSINAAILAVTSNIQYLFDAVLDEFSKSRWARLPMRDQIMPTSDSSVIPLIKNRLSRAHTTYIKLFCYRMLTLLPSEYVTDDATKLDLNSPDINLKLGALVYLAHNEPNVYGELFIHFLKDNHWEIRARAAKLLGEIGYESFAGALEACLRDPVRLVRNNAANALVLLGEKGLLILKKQSPDMDQNAYEAATHALSNALRGGAL